MWHLSSSFPPPTLSPCADNLLLGLLAASQEEASDSEEEVECDECDHVGRWVDGLCHGSLSMTLCPSCYNKSWAEHPDNQISAMVTLQRAWRAWRRRRRNAAIVIQRAWRRCRYEPTYKMCSTVLLHNLEELGAIVSAADATH